MLTLGIVESKRDVVCPECKQPARKIVFRRGKGASCLDCFQAATIKRLWQALFPKPVWVREFEDALEADTKAREEMYREWIATMTGGLQ